MINCIHLTVKMNKDTYDLKDLFYTPENIETDPREEQTTNEYKPIELIAADISYFNKYH
ncbi:MAG: hypothetical protein ACRC41_12905 [Sarcina sp.]